MWRCSDDIDDNNDTEGSIAPFPTTLIFKLLQVASPNDADKGCLDGVCTRVCVRASMYTRVY